MKWIGKVGTAIAVDQRHRGILLKFKELNGIMASHWFPTKSLNLWLRPVNAAIFKNLPNQITVDTIRVGI